MKITKKCLIMCLAVVAVAFAASAEAAEADVTWCLTGDATYRIDQQPMRAYCPAVAIGSVVGAWYAPQYAGIIVGRTQKQWSQTAASLSCAPNPAAQAAAVGLIAACQCHNKGAADWVMSHPAKTLEILRTFAHCGHASAIPGEVLTAVSNTSSRPAFAHACSVSPVENSCAIEGKQGLGTPCTCSTEGKQYSGVAE
ncbi:hypothetical protein NDK50_34915 [Paraburkholderia bryophila]|uniref:hypothetical protein n=1 Tax=Paraburkholderia bryophila TaxID=420952 RepID=UPI00234B5818|nr:hypothetical protein [Paraburkholderia bryophila]WCM23144.1 hypothetical protein NDK50_34915 [Paraburkholderia bryophila]